MIKLIENSINYFVTTEGEVYSGHRKLRTSPTGSGYARVRISYQDGTSKDCYVHRLVAQTFIPNPENKPVVNHKDADKTNNKLENLEWCTYKENTIHAVQNGLITYGFETANSRYTEKQIRDVFQKMEEGWRYKDISEITGVEYQHIINLRNNVRHKIIAEEYKIPPPRSTKISVATVQWICGMLEKGYTDRQIAEMSTNSNVNRTKVRFIRLRYTFTEISKDYDF